MISYRDVINGLRLLNVPSGRPVIAHASLSSFGEVRGGAETLLGAVTMVFNRSMMPAFTYKTMLIPEDGPEENGVDYGSGKDVNRMTEFFSSSTPVDPLMGVMAEKLRQMPGVRRSSHPILSFSGLNVEEALRAQTVEEPLAPIGSLAREDGWVLLLGVDHTVNTSIHYGEKLAGRKQFTRWALTPQGVRACPGFPGCSDGFNKIAPLIAPVVRAVKIGSAQVQAVPLPDLLDAVTGVIGQDALALLCDRPDCERCLAVRRSVKSVNN